MEGGSVRRGNTTTARLEVQEGARVAMAMALAIRVACDKEGDDDSNKGDGNVGGG
jgi:hypothetical protein